MEIGSKLKNARNENGITQEQAAELLGVSRQTISNWELNITKPDTDHIKKMSKIFNISIDEMLDNGELGILIPPQNVEAIKNTFIEIRNNTSLLDGYSNKIHKTYELGDKSWDNAVEILDKAIKEWLEYLTNNNESDVLWKQKNEVFVSLVFDYLYLIRKKLVLN